VSTSREINVSVDTIYRFLDKLNNKLKDQVEQITFKHTLKTLGGSISVVFYDMMTLYFEASDEDDLRKTGFSKDGKHQNPQIFIGLLVGLEGYAIGYDIFEGNIYEGHTLIPFIKTISEKFNIEKPVIMLMQDFCLKRINSLLKKKVMSTSLEEG
jgi:transposase